MEVEEVDTADEPQVLETGRGDDEEGDGHDGHVLPDRAASPGVVEPAAVPLTPVADADGPRPQDATLQPAQPQLAPSPSRSPSQPDDEVSGGESQSSLPAAVQITIPTTREDEEETVLYSVCVHVDGQLVATAFRRFREFASLDEILRQHPFGVLLLDLPPKAQFSFMSSASKTALSRFRQQALEAYLVIAMQAAGVSNSTALCNFLNLKAPVVKALRERGVEVVGSGLVASVAVPAFGTRRDDWNAEARSGHSTPQSAGVSFATPTTVGAKVASGAVHVVFKEFQRLHEQLRKWFPRFMARLSSSFPAPRGAMEFGKLGPLEVEARRIGFDTFVKDLLMGAGRELVGLDVVKYFFGVDEAPSSQLTPQLVMSSSTSIQSSVSSVRTDDATDHRDVVMQQLAHTLATEPNGEVLARMFQLLSRLGQGTFGAVYRALHVPSSRVVAVKIVKITSPASQIGAQREVDILRTSQGPHVVELYGSFISNSKLWIVMEYCAAGSITDIMAGCRITLTEEQIAAVLAPMLIALSAIHARSCVHRDVKSDNIVLTHLGHPKLADFGAAEQLIGPDYTSRVCTGTPYWMAPEVVASAPYGNKCDVWSLGITALELALGDPPNFDKHPQRAMFLTQSGPPPAVAELLAASSGKWSPVFVDFIVQCLVKDHTVRPSVAQMLAHPFIAKYLERFSGIPASVMMGPLQPLVDLGLHAAQRKLIAKDARMVRVRDGLMASAAGGYDYRSIGKFAPGTVVLGSSDSKQDVGAAKFRSEFPELGSAPAALAHRRLKSGPGRASPRAAIDAAAEPAAETISEATPSLAASQRADVPSKKAHRPKQLSKEATLEQLMIGGLTANVIGPYFAPSAKQRKHGQRTAASPGGAGAAAGGPAAPSAAGPDAGADGGSAAAAAASAAAAPPAAGVGARGGGRPAPSAARPIMMVTPRRPRVGTMEAVTEDNGSGATPEMSDLLELLSSTPK